MSFWDMAKAVGKAVEEEGNKALDNRDKKFKEILRTKSDAEIERIYNNRYDNPKFTSRIIEIVEKEASRRGIS